MKLKFFNAEDSQAIHRAALKILREIGILERDTIPGRCSKGQVARKVWKVFFFSTKI
jgi:trimethylamine:corrinoid methyltransferase-like protein